MITIGDIWVFFRSDTSDVDSTARGLESRMSSAGERAGSGFANAFQVAVGNTISSVLESIFSRIGDALSTGFGAVAAFENLTASVEAMSAKELVVAGVTESFAGALDMVGEHARATIQWIEKLAIQSPFGAEDVQAAFKLAQAYGFVSTATSSVEEAQQRQLPTAQRLTQAMLNYVAATGQSPAIMQRVALALGQMSATGKVMAGDLNQLANAGIGARRILADEFAGGSMAALQKMTKQGLIPADQAIEAILQDMEIVGSAASRQANTWGGLVNSLKDIASFSLRDLMMPAIEPIRPLIMDLVAWLQSDDVRGAFSSIGEAIGDKIAIGVQWLGQAIAGAQSAWAAISPYVQAVNTALVAFGQIVLGLAGEAASWAAGILEPFDSLLQFFASLADTLGLNLSSGLSILPGILGETFSSLIGLASDYGDGTVEAFAQGLASGVGYVVDALMAIAATVTSWLQPHSPPRILPHIDQWGTQTAQTWLDAWGDAEFSALSDFAQAAGTALSNAVGRGLMGDVDQYASLLAVREGMSAVIEELRTTGQVSEATFASIRAAGGAAGPEIEALARAYTNLTRSTLQLEEAEKRIQGLEFEIEVGQADLIAAQASGNAALVAAARNRITQLKLRKQDAQQERASAKERQQQAKLETQRQEQLLGYQAEQVRILQQMQRAQEAEARERAQAAKERQRELDEAARKAKEAADAQWQYNYSIADTDTKLAMLRARQADYTSDQAEYWRLQGQIADVEQERRTEQERAAQDAEKDAQRRADAEWDYNYAIADNAGKLAMLQDKLAGLNQGSEEYWDTLRKIDQVQEAIDKEAEKAAKGAKGAKGAKAGPAAPGFDPGEAIRERWANFQEEMGKQAGELGKQLGERVQEGVRNRAARVAAAFKSWFAQLIDPSMPAQIVRTLGGIRNIVVNLALTAAPRIVNAFNTWSMALLGWVDDAWHGLMDAIGDVSVELINIVGRRLPDLQAAFGRWGIALLEWVGANGPEMLRDLGTLIGRILTAVSQNAPKILGAFATWSTALVQSFLEVLPVLLFNLGQIVVQVVSWALGQVPALITGFGAWAMGLLDAFANAWPTLLGVLSGLIGNLITTIGEALPGIISAFMAWGLGMLQWLYDNGPRMIGELLTNVGELLDTLGRALPGIVESLATWGAALVAWVIQAAPGLFAQLLTLIGAVLQWIYDRVPGIAAQLAEWAIAFIQWVGPAAGDLIVALGVMFGTLLGWLIEQVPKLTENLLKWAAAFTDWISTTAIPALNTSLNDLITTITDWISGQTETIISQAAQIGKWLVDGIWKGIQDSWAWLEGQWNGLVAGLPLVGGQAIDAHSPSQAAADSVGTPLVQGILMGMQAAIGQVMVAIQTMMTSLLLALGQTLANGLLLLGPLLTAQLLLLLPLWQAGWLPYQTTIDTMLLAIGTAMVTFFTVTLPTLLTEPMAAVAALWYAFWYTNLYLTIFQPVMDGMANYMSLTMQAMADKIRQGSGLVAGAAQGLGNQIAQGAEGGIKAAAGRVADAAAKMVRDAIAAARREADVASPSKKTDELGQQMGTGAEQGIIKTIPDIQQAARDASAAAIEGFGLQPTLQTNNVVQQTQTGTIAGSGALSGIIGELQRSVGLLAQAVANIQGGTQVAVTTGPIQNTIDIEALAYQVLRVAQRKKR